MNHILVIDDNNDTKELLEAAANASGDIKITVLNSATQAIEYLARDSNYVDGVLIDLAMFPIDGISLAERIRKMERIAPFHKKLKLAFFTAQPIDSVINRAAQESDVRAKSFKKPVEPFKLIREVKDWLAE